MKNSFILYGSWGPMIKAMSDEGAGQLLKACFAFSAGEAFAIENETAAAIFETVKATMQADQEKYNEVSKKRREAALASKRKQNDANVSKSSFCSDLFYESDSESDSDSDKDLKEKDKKEKDKKEKPLRAVFKKPTVDEVKAYCQERGNNIDPNAFVDFYSAKGWRVGNQPMKDWKACVRTWERRDQKEPPKKKVGFSNYESQRQYSDDQFRAIERMMRR